MAFAFWVLLAVVTFIRPFACNDFGCAVAVAGIENMGSGKCVDMLACSGDGVGVGPGWSGTLLKPQ